MPFPQITSRTLLAVAFLCSPFPVYGNGLIPIHRSPSSDIAGYGLLLSLVCALAGLTIAFRRTGFAALPLLLGFVLAGFTIWVCLWFLNQQFGGVEPAFLVGSIGLLLSFGVFVLWYRTTARKGVVVGSILTFLACAAVIAIVCVIVFRLSIDHWESRL